MKRLLLLAALCAAATLATFASHARRHVSLAPTGFAPPTSRALAATDTPPVRTPVRTPAPTATAVIPPASTPAADSGKMLLDPSARDTSTIVVEGPMIVAFMPANIGHQVDADTSGDVATVMDDFMWYIAEASDSLAARGVVLQVRAADTLRFEVRGQGARRWSWAPPRDSADIGFYLVSPTRGPHVLYGVQVMPELVQAVFEQLGAGAAPRFGEP